MGTPLPKKQSTIYVIWNDAIRGDKRFLRDKHGDVSTYASENRANKRIDWEMGRVKNWPSKEDYDRLRATLTIHKLDLPYPQENIEDVQPYPGTRCCSHGFGDYDDCPYC